jgi:hypothetical protein
MNTGKSLPQFLRDEIIRLITTTTMSYTSIAALAGCSEWTVNKIARVENIRRGRGPLSPSHPLYKEKA